MTVDSEHRFEVSTPAGEATCQRCGRVRRAGGAPDARESYLPLESERVAGPDAPLCSGVRGKSFSAVSADLGG